MSPSDKPEKPAESDPLYRFVGRHAETLESGLPLGPGDVVSLSQSDLNKNKHLVESGQLIEAAEGSVPIGQEPEEEGGS